MVLKLKIVFFTGITNDAVGSELAETRDGPVAGDVCYRIRTGRTAVNYAELVSSTPSIPFQVPTLPGEIYCQAI